MFQAGLEWSKRQQPLHAVSTSAFGSGTSLSNISPLFQNGAPSQAAGRVHSFRPPLRATVLVNLGVALEAQSLLQQANVAYTQV
jgi:hypothetical protein